MAYYRVLKPCGPWLTPGQIISDDDIKKVPGMGGAQHMIEKRRCIEPASDKGTVLPANPGKPAVTRVPGPKPAPNVDEGAEKGSG